MDTNKPTKEQWKDIVREGDEAFDRAKTVPEDWGVDGISGADMYEAVFEKLIAADFETFEHWAEIRKEKGQSTHVLDLFGGGYMFDDFTNVDSVTAIRLHNEDERLKQKYRSIGNSTYLNRITNISANSKRAVIENNIFSHTSWMKLHKRMAELHTNKLDLIIVRPLAGIELKENVEGMKIHFIQNLKRAYSLLAKENGMILAQVPAAFVPLMDEFCTLLEKTPGITVEKNLISRTCKIVKSETAPAILPPEVWSNLVD